MNDMMAACGVHMVEFCLNYDIVGFQINEKQPWDFGHALNAAAFRTTAKARAFAAFAS